MEMHINPDKASILTISFLILLYSNYFVVYSQKSHLSGDSIMSSFKANNKKDLKQQIKYYIICSNLEQCFFLLFFFKENPINQ